MHGILLVLCMAAAPCVTEIGSVFAEPDTDTDIEPVAYKVTLNDAQNGKGIIQRFRGTNPFL